MFEIILSTVAALFLIILSFYALIRQRTAANIAFSIIAFFIALIEVLDQYTLYSSYDPLVLKRVVIFFESFLPLTFLFFSLIYSRRNIAKSLSFLWWVLISLTILFPVSVSLLSIDNFFYSPDLLTERMLFLEKIGYWFYIGVMLYCVIALINLEATFSYTAGRDRWKMKFEVIGMSSILAVLIFYFSQGLLYRAINMNLIPIRSGVLIVASMLIGYSRFFRGNGARIAVSRYIAYRSVTLLVVGIYLLALGLIGEGMKYLDVAFSRDLTIFTAFATGIAIIIVLFSERLRRLTKVFINKHFYAHKHDYRNEWLKFTGRLTECRTISDVQDAILDTYKETFVLKGASLYLFDKGADRYRLSAFHSMPHEPVHLNAEGLISYFIEKGRVYNPLDHEYIPSQEEAEFVRLVRARLIVPLIGNESVEGFVVLGEKQVKDEFTYEDYDLMKTFARQASSVIVNLRLSEELSMAREMETIGKISTFVMHDLKNLTSALSLVLENAKEYINDPDFQKDTLDSISNTVVKMKSMMLRLRNLREKEALRTEPADLHKIIRDAISMMNSEHVRIEGSSVIANVDREEIEKVVLNLILNAIEANKGEGKVIVEVGQGDAPFIRVRDKGCGMTEEFINNHLFKPFSTTKSKGLGIGLYQCRQIVHSHGGSIDVSSEPGKGSVFTVYLPLCKIK
ncbi:MAG: PEP-CTERM system histidine kinase PrsK [Nitrospirae bacterium]|nr:PEP-CTERM system histidine kinase PrsK [Nitrospirota bacterium]